MEAKKKLSYSSWSTYTLCPFKWKCKNILGLDEGPSGPAAERGTLIHNTIEKYIKGESTQLPWDGSIAKVPPLGDKHPLDALVKKLRAEQALTEFRVCFNYKWEPWPKEVSETAVVVLDAVKCYTDRVEVHEWKSGKPDDGHAEQRLLYALGSLQIWKAPKTVVTTYYVDMTGDAKRLTVPREKVGKLIEIWNERKATMDNDTIHAPKPNSKCRWCAFSRAKGGPCAF